MLQIHSTVCYNMRIYNILYFYISMFCTDTCHKQPLGEVLHSVEICFVTSLLNGTRYLACLLFQCTCLHISVWYDHFLIVRIRGLEHLLRHSTNSRKCGARSPYGSSRITPYVSRWSISKHHYFCWTCKCLYWMKGILRGYAIVSSRCRWPLCWPTDTANQGLVSLRLMTSQFKYFVTHMHK